MCYLSFSLFNNQKCPCQHLNDIVLMLFECIFIQRQKEQLHAKIIQLQKQLDKKQELELEIQQLKGSLNVLKHMDDYEDAEVLKKVDTLQKDLRDKEQSLQDLDELNQALIIKERESNDELQEARQALVDVSVFFIKYIFLLTFQINLQEHLNEVHSSVIILSLGSWAGSVSFYW